MVEVSASINAGEVGRFNYALGEFAAALGKDISSAPRRAAIQICKSLRAGTRKAPAYPRSAEIVFTKSDTLPKHVHRGGKDYRRWHIDRGGAGRGSFERMTATAPKRSVFKLFHRGLAKQSWGWVMHNIFKGSAPDAPWQRRKKDRHNPKDSAKDSTSREQRGQSIASGFARICNRLPYITDALKVSVDEAVTKATNWMLHEAERRRPKL